jgi:hypothetical protein
MADSGAPAAHSATLELRAAFSYTITSDATWNDERTPPAAYPDRRIGTHGVGDADT